MAFNGFRKPPSPSPCFPDQFPRSPNFSGPVFPGWIREPTTFQADQSYATSMPNPFNPLQIIGRPPSSQSDTLATDIEMTDVSDGTYPVEMDWEPVYPQLDPAQTESNHGFNSCFDNIQSTASTSRINRCRNPRDKTRCNKVHWSRISHSNQLRRRSKPFNSNFQKPTPPETLPEMMDIDEPPQNFHPVLNNKPQVAQSHCSRGFHTSYIQAALESHFISASRSPFNSQQATNGDPMEGVEFHPITKVY